MDYALWDDIIIIKYAIKTLPYALVYGKRLVLPIYLELPALKIIQELEDYDFEPLQIRFDQLMKLEEEKKKGLINPSNIENKFSKNGSRKISLPS